MARLLPQSVDAPVRGTRTLGAGELALTSAWAYQPIATCDQASAKGAPAGELVEYAVVVEGEGAVYIAEGDVTAIDPAPPGIRVIAGAPFYASCRGAGLEGLSLRSVPDGVTGQLVVASTSFSAGGGE